MDFRKKLISSKLLTRNRVSPHSELGRGGDPMRELLSQLKFLSNLGHKSIANSILQDSSYGSVILRQLYHKFRKQMSTGVNREIMEHLGDLVENHGDHAITSILLMLKLMSQLGHKYIQSGLVEGLYNQSREQMSIEVCSNFQELEAEIFNYLVSGSMSQYHSDGMEISKMIHEIQQDIKRRLERHHKRLLHEKLEELAEERRWGNARLTGFARSLYALNWQPSSSAMAHDMPLCPHSYGTSDEADVSNQDDFQSRVASYGVASSSGVGASVHGRRHTRDPGADATSEIGYHNFEMSDDPIEIRLDDPIEIRLEVSDNGDDDDDPSETRPEESDHVGGHFNAIAALVGGQAVVNLIASHSPDSLFLRHFAVFACCSFVGSLYANSRLKNQKVAEYLTKFSAICLLFAVNIALGVNVLEGTKWHLNIVVTVALCIASVALVARADIGPPTAPASNQSRTSRQMSEASSSSQAGSCG